MEPLICKVTESLLNFLAFQGYRISKEKAQLCLLSHLPRCGLKGKSSLPESWVNPPNPPFPLPHTIKQLRAFLGVIGFCRIWIPRYAALARPFFMLLLILLFGPCIINDLSRFISQQVQWIKLQLLVKKYLCLHISPPSHSIGGPWRLHRSTPETSTPSPIPSLPHCQHKAARWVIAPSPTAIGCLSQRGDLLGLET
jgi:hypothetical protein